MSQLELVLIGAAIGVAFTLTVIVGVFVGQALHDWWRLHATRQLRAEMDAQGWPPMPRPFPPSPPPGR